VRPAGEAGCFVGYASQTDPKGTLPSWMVNKVTTIFAPKVLKILQKASQGYPNWKINNNPSYKPWFFPEQISAPRITAEDCGAVARVKKSVPAPTMQQSKPLNTQPCLSQPNCKDDDSASIDDGSFSCVPGLRLSLRYFTKGRKNKAKDPAAASDNGGKLRNN